MSSVGKFPLRHVTIRTRKNIIQKFVQVLHVLGHHAKLTYMNKNRIVIEKTEESEFFRYFHLNMPPSRSATSKKRYIIERLKCKTELLTPNILCAFQAQTNKIVSWYDIQV